MKQNAPLSDTCSALHVTKHDSIWNKASISHQLAFARSALASGSDAGASCANGAVISRCWPFTRMRRRGILDAIVKSNCLVARPFQVIKREILMTFWTSFWGSGKDAIRPTSPKKTACLGFFFKSVMIQCPNATQKRNVVSSSKTESKANSKFPSSTASRSRVLTGVFLATNDNTLPENEQLKHLKRWRIPKGKDQLPTIHF